MHGRNILRIFGWTKWKEALNEEALDIEEALIEVVRWWRSAERKISRFVSNKRCKTEKIVFCTENKMNMQSGTISEAPACVYKNVAFEQLTDFQLLIGSAHLFLSFHFYALITFDIHFGRWLWTFPINTDKKTQFKFLLLRFFLLLFLVCISIFFLFHFGFGLLRFFVSIWNWFVSIFCLSYFWFVVRFYVVWRDAAAVEPTAINNFCILKIQI